MVHHIKWRKYEVMAIAPSSAVTLAGAEQAVRAGIAAAQKSGVEMCGVGRKDFHFAFIELL